MRNNHTLLILCVLTTLITGCAAVVVGGMAATGVALIHDRRSAGTVIDDENIELKASARLLNNAELRQNAHVNVTSYNALVLLTGEAPSLDLKKKIEALVRRVPNVREVYNELRIAGPSAYLSRSSDTLITSKIKTGLIQIRGIPGFDPTRVKIVTENGTVFLMGLLTQQEAQQVSNYTRSVGGVEKVIKIVEYLN